MPEDDEPQPLPDSNGRKPAPDDEEIDLIALARGGAGTGPTSHAGAPATDAEAEAPDATLGGYMERHDRPAAFEGADGQPYTADLALEPAEPADDGWVAYFVFLRWAATGAGIMGHLDSDDVAHGETEEQARERALALPLGEVKAALDAAIRRKAEDNAT